MVPLHGVLPAGPDEQQRDGFVVAVLSKACSHTDLESSLEQLGAQGCRGMSAGVLMKLGHLVAR